MTPQDNTLASTRPCECGCGGIITSKYTATDKRTGKIKGQLLRFLPGHQMRASTVKRWATYTEEKFDELGGKKVCGRCKEPKPLDEFYVSKIGLFKVSYYCKLCSGKINADWYGDNPEWASAKNKSIYQRVKEKVFEKYGGACTCCGETEPMFLTIDHVNNDGGGRNRKERGYAMYQKLIEMGYPDTRQVLCWNCNVGKQRNGGVCPHKSKVQ